VRRRSQKGTLPSRSLPALMAAGLLLWGLASPQALAQGAGQPDPGQAAAGQTAAGKPATEEPAPEEVRVAVEAPTGKVPIGVPFEVRYRLEYPVGSRVFFPEKPEVAPLVLVEARHQVSSVLGVSGSEEHLLRLLPVRRGTGRVPSIEIPWVAASGEARTARTPEVTVEVASSLQDTEAPELTPAGTPVAVRVPNLPLLIAAGALAVALLAAVAAIWGWRRYQAWKEAHRPPPPPRPAHEVALEKLTALEARGLVEAGEYQALALGVSEVLREFLGALHGFQGVDLTTWEVLRALEGRDLGRITRMELEDFLSFCDLVKFAKYRPAPAEAQGMVPRARDIVMRAMEGRLPGTAAGA